VGMQAMEEVGPCQLAGIVYRCMWHALSCWNMRWWRRMNDTTMGLRVSSRYLCAFKWPTIKYNCVHCPQLMPAHTITPPPSWDTLFTTMTSAKPSPTWHHTRGLQLAYGGGLW
jgi:hypothetical protein